MRNLTIPANGDIEIKNGYNFGGALGVRLTKHIRFEGELSRAKSDISSIHYGGNEVNLGGELTLHNAMVNAYYDFDVPWKLQPYIGAGLGIGWFEGEINAQNASAIDASDDAMALTWQLGTGVKYRVSPSFAFTGGYRYLDSMDLAFDTYDIDFSSHEFRIGLEYDFPIR